MCIVYGSWKGGSQQSTVRKSEEDAAQFIVNAHT